MIERLGEAGLADPIIRNCKFCGDKIEWCNRQPVDYHSGSIHRCLGKGGRMN